METNSNVKIRQPRRTGRRIGDALLILLLSLAFLCFFSACWYVSVYGRIGFDSVIYTLTSNLGGVQLGLVLKYFAAAVLPAALCTTAMYFLLLRPWKKSHFLAFGKHRLRLPQAKRWVACLLCVVLSLALMAHAAFNVELIDYISACLRISNLYESEYRDPDSVNITFPEQKRNLIYIMLESMETSYLSTDEGGALEYNLIPELYELAQDNVNFSHNTSLGGFREVPGASWTIGAMVSQTSGVPLKVPDGILDWQNGYGEDGVFLPGLTSLSTILAENGYNQALMVGSDSDFGGRKTYFSTHGVENIYDLYTARADGIVPSNYFVWWGMEDKYLFEYAKQEITEMAAQDEPFAFTMLTVDTHHIGGYTCEYCGSDHEESYENVISCSSKQVYAFVEWLQQQDFYENTTIIVTGDHCSMDNGYFTRNVDDGYIRHVYNCFINSAVEPVRTSNRNFSALDMFPSTLAAMGCTIEGNRLGLGTNLFSNTPTLIERFGYGVFCTELSQRSDYYADHFYTAEEES